MVNKKNLKLLWMFLKSKAYYVHKNMKYTFLRQYRIAFIVIQIWKPIHIHNGLGKKLFRNVNNLDLFLNHFFVSKRICSAFLLLLLFIITIVWYLFYLWIISYLFSGILQAIIVYYLKKYIYILSNLKT